MTFTVTVNPTPLVNHVDDVTLCKDATGSITFGTVTTGGTVTYNWTSSEDVGFGKGPSTGSITTFTAKNTTALPITAIVSVTATVNGCTGPAITFNVTVNPMPVLTSTLTPNAMCSGLFTYQPTSSTPGTTFSWTRAAVPGISVWGISNQPGSGNDAIMEALTNTTGAALDVTYVYTLSANNCTNPTTFSVVVKVKATTAITANGDLTDALKCVNESATFTVNAGGTNNKYEWHKSNVGIITTGGNYVISAAGNALTVNNIQIADAGNYYVVITGDCGTTQSRSAHLMVKEFKISTNPDKTPDSAQYSDPVTFTAKIYNGLSLLYSSPVPYATFKVAGVAVPGAESVTFIRDVVTNDLIAETTQPLLETGLSPNTPPNGPMAPSNTKHNVTAEFNNIPSPLLLTSNCGTLDTNLVITKENAWIAYTGDVIKATKSATTDTVTLQLRANIMDISVPQMPTSPLADAYPGDIRNARVTFVDRESKGTGAGYLNGYQIIGTPNLTPTLVSPLDTKVGSVTGSLFMSGMTSTTPYSFRTIGIIVDYGYYVRDSADDNVVLTGYMPAGDFITGGGFIVPTESVGTKASDDYKKTNFGFNVKFNKQGTNLQGNMNIIFRRTGNDGLVHNYQIKANSMQSLGVDASNPNRQTAEFVSKVTLRDLNSTTTTTDPDLGGNKYLYVKMIDNGEPGANDSISFVVVNGTADPTIFSNVIWSSNWVGSRTQMMNLTGGNLVVHSGFSVAPPGPANRITQGAYTEPGVPPFAVQAWPNPSDRQFNLRVTGNLTEKVIIKVYDISGKQLYITSGAANQDYRFGDTFVAGVYIVEVQQGDKRSKIKLIKQ
jgi:hypothetical protein